MVRMLEDHLYCVHTIRFSELTKNLQFVPNDHAKFVSDENRACSISIRSFKITDPFDGRPF